MSVWINIAAAAVTGFVIVSITLWFVAHDYHPKPCRGGYVMITTLVNGNTPAHVCVLGYAPGGVDGVK